MFVKMMGTKKGANFDNKSGNYRKLTPPPGLFAYAFNPTLRVSLIDT
jgi:hypothetical protein